MAIYRTRMSTIVALGSALIAATACVALGPAGPAAAETGVDVLVGGAQCGLAPPTSCQPSQATFTLPGDGPSAIQVGFTKNNNPCPDLGVRIDEGGTRIALGSVVPLPAGVHTLNVTPTCSQPLTSWGGTVHVSFIKQTGKPPGQDAPAAAVVPNNAAVVNVSQTSTKVIVKVSNSSKVLGTCNVDATPTNNPLLPSVHRDGTLPAIGSVSWDLLAPPLGSTYHLVVSCQAQAHGENMGHFEKDVTGSI
jgi:hypothetical protein